QVARHRQWYRPRSIARSIAIRPRVYVAMLAALAAALLLPHGISAHMRPALSGDIGAAVYLALGMRMMSICNRDSIRKRAARQDDSAIVILMLILVAITFGFWTIFGVLGEAKREAGQAQALLILLAAITLLLSWLVTQVVFTFHYA